MLEQPAFAGFVTSVAAQGSTGMHHPMTRDPELHGASAECVAGGPGRARVAGHGRDVAVGPQLAVRDRGGDLEHPAWEAFAHRTGGRAAWTNVVAVAVEVGLRLSRRMVAIPRTAGRAVAPSRSSNPAIVRPGSSSSNAVATTPYGRDHHRELAQRGRHFGDAQGPAIRRQTGGHGNGRSPWGDGIVGLGEDRVDPSLHRGELVLVQQGRQVVAERSRRQRSREALHVGERARWGSVRPCAPRSRSEAWVRRGSRRHGRSPRCDRPCPSRV